MKKADKNDMLLLKRIFSYTSPDAMPVSFNYDGQHYRGIPSANAKVEYGLYDANISYRTVTAKIAPELIVRAEYTEYRDFPAVELILYFTNESDKRSAILSGAEALCGVIADGRELYFGNGDTCGEDGYEFFRSNLSSPVSLAPRDGTPCNGAFPYMRLLCGGEDECGVNIAVGWPAMWRADISRADGGVELKIGQKRLHTYLEPGETVRTPRVTLLAYSGDEDAGRNMWRAWYFAHILPREGAKPLEPKLCVHTWMVDGFPEFTGITEKNQIDGIDDYLRGGFKPDIWWIDAGWYPCDHNWPYVGTWRCDNQRLPHELTPVGEKCEENGIQLLLWFEPERVIAGTELDREHPDWLLCRHNDDGTVDATKLFNLGNKAACDWLIEYIDAFIKRNRVDIYRQDFNMDPQPIWVENESADRVGMLENQHVQGYLRYFDALVLRNPDLWIDSCASGGRRNELETMRRAVPLHYTDVGYGKHTVKQKQHREMFEWIPYFRAHTMNWDNAEGGYENGGRPVDEFAYYNAFAPSLTSMIEHNSDENGFRLGRKMNAVWRRAAALMLGTDFYPLTECRKDTHDFYAVQFDDPDDGRGFIEVIANTQCDKGSVTLHPHVEESAEYTLENSVTGEIKIMDGKMLSEFTVRLERRSAVVWFYSRRNKA